MRQSDPPVSYVVGTPKGRLTQLEKDLLELPWQEARPSVQVKLLSQKEKPYVLVESQDRVSKEHAMRRRRLKKLWARLKELQAQRPSYEQLLLKWGAARQEDGRAWALVAVTLPDPPPKNQRVRRVDFTFSLLKGKLHQIRQREGRYLLRSNLTEIDPARLWNFYLQLTEVEAAFKNLKEDLAVRPIFYQKLHRIEAHIFAARLPNVKPTSAS